MAKSSPPSVDAFEQAVAYWRALVPVTDAEFQQLADDLKPLAFRVAAGAQADLVTQVYEALDSAIADGTTFEDFQDDVSERLGDSWGEAEGAPSLENTFRTSVMTAYAGGRYEIMDQARESHPMSRFDVIEDSRLCDICEPLDGVIRPADEWTGKTPPLHYQCRCILTPLTEDDAQKEGVADKVPDTDVGEGFGNPERGQNWEPDVSAYPAPIQDILGRRLSSDE